MRIRHAVVATLLLASASAHAQFPPRGQPDPSFNAGRPRIVAGSTQAAGADYAVNIVPLTATRYAVQLGRPFDPKDAVMIVDTTPERATVFDVRIGTPASIEGVSSLASAGTTLVIGGTVYNDDGTQSSSLQVREIGVAAAPAFDEHDSLIMPSSSNLRPRAFSNAVAARRASDHVEIWRSITEYTTDFGCAASTLQRFDHNGHNFLARYALDLTATLVRTCLDVIAAVAAPARAADPAGSTAFILAAICQDQAGGRGYVCLTRVLDTGSALVVDRAWASNGLVVSGVSSTLDTFVIGLALDADGGSWVSANRSANIMTDSTALLIHVKPDGAVDTAFGTAGALTMVPVGTLSLVRGVTVTPNGIVEIVGASVGTSGNRPFIFYYDPASGSPQFARLEFLTTEPNYAFALYAAVVPLPANGALVAGAAYTDANTSHTLVTRLAGDRQTLDVLEYYHAVFDHFFVTAIAAEMNALDTGAFVGWQRTGEAFAVLPIGAAGASDVCRFFSAAFAPKSSHFYTPVQSECAGLQAGNVWTYEGLVFALQLPSAAGVCPAGTTRLFRQFNNGQGGAPNHRYIVKDALRLAQVLLGWIEEGNGSPPVFACVVR